MPHDKKQKHKIVYQVARTRAELEQVFSLVYKEYKSRGFIPKYYKSKLRLSLYNAIPSTTTFIAKKKNKIIATVTLISDSGMGILMDKLYKKEIDVLRKKGRKVTEGSQLALDSKLFPKNWYSMFNFKKLIFMFKLFKLVIDYAVYIEKVDDICIVFNPRHQYLYKFIGFRQIGKLKYYGTFHSPAIAMRLNLNTAEKELRSKKGLHKIFFDKKTDSSVFKNKYQLTMKDLEYFFVKKSDFFKKATKKEINYIKNCYPKEKKEIEKVIKKSRQ